MDTLKSRKEAFVTGHEGSNLFEVLWVCSSVVWGCWLYAEWLLLLVLLQKNKHKHKSKPTIIVICGTPQKLVAEALLVWVPMVVAQTHYLYPYGSLWMVGEIAAASILYRKRRMRITPTATETPKATTTATQHPQESQLSYLTLYRSSIYFLTFVAILAVDFPLFPRKFCKTEVAGYGLMDVGAACFVFSGGMVSGKSYCKTNTNTNNSNSNHSSTVSSLLGPLVKALPLIVIGIIRCITNKELEYQEHVTEYGVHWNFFFTLGVLAVVPTLRKQLLLWLRMQNPEQEHEQAQNQQQQQQQLHIQIQIQIQTKVQTSVYEMVERWVFWAPLVVMVLYQYELVFGRDDMNGLKSFILTAPRSPDDNDHGNGNDDDDASFSFSFASVFSAPFFVFLNHTIRTLWRRFFFANREGILGCLGYSFLHAAGEWVGQHYVFGSSDNSLSSSSSSIWPLGKLTVCAWMALYSLNLVFNLTVSRREMNLSFCLWAIAHNLTILFGFKVMTAAVLTQTQTQMQTQMQSNSSSNSSNKTTNNNSDNNININNSETETDIDISNNEPTIDIVPLAFGAVNRHGMVSFLVANLLTGLINLLVPTIDQGDGVAMAILVAYLFAVGGVALLLDHSSSKNNKSIERCDEPTLATKKIN